MNTNLQIAIAILWIVGTLCIISLYTELERAFFKTSPYVIRGNRGRRKFFLERLIDGLGF